MSFFTSGSVPSAPEAPALSEQSVTSITVSWARRQEDEEFLLQMEDETTVCLGADCSLVSLGELFGSVFLVTWSLCGCVCGCVCGWGGVGG